MDAISHPRSKEYLTWADAEVMRHIGLVRKEVLELSGASYSAEPGAPAERVAQFTKMTATVRRLADKYGKTP